MTVIFLSYASESNSKPGDATSRGWVTAVDQALSQKLRRLRDVKLWRDVRDFDVPGSIREGLSQAIENADFLLPVLSTDYNIKEYTQYELGKFFEVVDAKTRELHRGAAAPTDFIIPLIPEPLPPEEFLAPLADAKHVQFFGPDETGQMVPFFRGFGLKVSVEFYDKIDEIVRLIEWRIKAEEKAKATVYLANTPTDQIKNYLSVNNELKSRKCSVNPKPQWPVNVPDARTFLSQALVDSQFSVHMLGATPGRELRSGLTEISSLQLDLAAERQKRDSKFRRLIWLPPDLTPTDPAQKALIDSLDNGSRLTDRDEFVRDGIEVFKEVIIEELERTGKSAEAHP
jgi:hypothetical protein